MQDSGLSLLGHRETEDHSQSVQVMAKKGTMNVSGCQD